MNMGVADQIHQLQPARSAFQQIEEHLDLIEQRLRDGVRISDIATVLGIKPKTLSNGLAQLRKIKRAQAQGSLSRDVSRSEPKAAPSVRGDRLLAKPVADETIPSAGSVARKTSALEQSVPDRGPNSTDYTPDDPLLLEGQWITGEPVRWWSSRRSGDAAPPASPLPLPLRYPLPENLRPAEMPPVPEWAIYDLKEMPGDRLQLPDTGSLFRKWWCYFTPRMPPGACLYGVLPGCDPEAPYGRYLDGRPYKADRSVWGIGQGGATRQKSMIGKVPPGETTPVDLALGFPAAESSQAGQALLLEPPDDPRVVAWKAAARHCGQPTDPPKVT